MAANPPFCQRMRALCGGFGSFATVWKRLGEEKAELDLTFIVTVMALESRREGSE